MHALCRQDEISTPAVELAVAARRSQQLEFDYGLSAKPIVKWAGGKGAVLPTLRALLPRGRGSARYFEPFVGGAALYFRLQPRQAVLADINAQLIATYHCVQRAVEPLIVRLYELARLHSEPRYEHRDRYNHAELEPLERAALFLYFNKTCFNGLHRVNRRGEFNVPLGRYANPRIVDAKALRAASRALQGVKLRHASFEAVLESAQPGDFVYFDPPYDSASDKPSFTQYAAPFGAAEQDTLAAVYRTLDARGCKLMLSNSGTSANRVRYAGYNLREIQAPRAISRHGTGRGKVTELVVLNYSTTAV